MKTFLKLAMTLMLSPSAFASAIEAPQLPGGKRATIIVYNKTDAGIGVDSVDPASGSVGLTIDRSEVERTIAILKTAGAKDSVRTVGSTKETVFELKDIVCVEEDRARAHPCSAGKAALPLDRTGVDALEELLMNYQGTKADFETYAEYGMKKISCKITEVGEINAVYRQCNFYY